MRKIGKQVKPWCFNTKARQIIKEVYPDDNGLKSFIIVYNCLKCHIDGLKVYVEGKAFHCEGRHTPEKLCTSIEQFHGKVI